MIAVYTGDDRFASQQALRARIESFVSMHGALALEQLDAEEATPEHIFDAVTSTSLLSNAKMVILRSASKQKDVLEKIINSTDNIPDTTEVLIVDPKLDKRATYYKQLRKTAEFNEFSTSNAADVTDWLVDYAKSVGGSLTRADANYLLQVVGSNKVLLTSEIGKLINYSSDITKQSIDELCEPLPQSTIFQLLDAAFAGNVNRALHLYEDQRKQRVEPLAILAMLAWQLQSIALVKTAGDIQPEEVAKQAKISPFVVRKNKTFADKLSIKQLRILVRKALELDVKLKSTSVDPDESLRHFLLSLSRV